ncbi:Acetamidase [Penicillium subrubescens]|uniref:amidase n=1 Tax=Penicillium subrubescens TaxID=1316194 RepID=A0A1Q5UFP7_9EURO|nr:Acetamidase [Penicillium subrubescens]
MGATESWKLAGEHKRNALLALIPSEWRLAQPLPSPEDVPDLRKGTIQSYLSCREISCLHEIFFQAALRDADACDLYIKKHGKPIGALHGLPVSLKDVVNIKDVDTTMGFVGLVGNATSISRESQIATLLRRLGAVLFVKTSVPTGSFTIDTFNNIIEHTANPCNRRFNVGGSSGGEGGLLALKGSPLGMGTDIGGSVRVPAVWNGCYGIRPSTGRVPYEGTSSLVDGQTAIPFVLGFMAPLPEAITHAMRSLLSLSPWMNDPLVHEIPWREEIYTQFKESASGVFQLSFGIMRTDHYVNVQPPVQRAMDIVVNKLKSLGHSKRAVTIDGGKAFHEAIKLSGEPPHRVDLGLVDAAKPVPATVFGLLPQPEASATEINGINIAIRDYRRSYLEYWNSTAEITGTGRPVDVFLMPVAPTPAPVRGKVRYFGYSTLANVLDFTACGIPVTEVQKDIDRYDDEDYVPLNELDKLVHDDYDPVLSDGTPVGIQVVGRRLQEEKVLAIAEVIGNTVNDLSERGNIKL